jgi:hypothetical protein
VWGHPRQTNHLDLVINLKQEDVSRFLAAFEADFACREDIRGVHMMSCESAFQVDLSLLNETPFDLAEFGRRERKNLLPDLEAWVFSAEDTILRKLHWYALGNRKSDKQWNDVVRVLEIREGLLDLAYLQAWAPSLGVSELLAEAISEVVSGD